MNQHPSTKQSRQIPRLSAACIVLLTFLSKTCSAAESVNFVRDVRPILEKHCYECHSEAEQESGFRLDVKEAALKGGDNHGPDIVPGKASESPLIHFITTDKEDEIMPPSGRLPAMEIETLTRWVNEGAIWPDGVDRTKLKDTRDHWSFKPLSFPIASLASPAPYSIDAFIEAKLVENGLAMSPEADRVIWLRRVSFDLIGLPPTLDQVTGFLNDERSDAFERVVDDLLNSERYGERWAQQWLDVVRYADTHGFEVNTERPNAWPYRDYVIRAFNNDTPYDRFIKEQIVGDAMGEDAATGFLVTASVLLPGQIGKDEPSKRLARQDALDEMVNNIGQTFLGLSVGCARCHDHKFDPISAKDYYSMQAIVAGVEYQDRELQTHEAIANRQRMKQIKTQVAALDKQLSRLVPLAKSGSQRPMVIARENVDRFLPQTAKRVRFTVRETNNLEPCIDELEVFTTAGENMALHGAVTVSGENVTADTHEQRFVNDGKYGNSRSWMSNEKGKGWVMIEFPQEYEIDRVIWGRDREGKFKDRLATSYVIEAADSSGIWKTVADSDDRKRYDAGKSPQPGFDTKGLRKDEAAEATKLLTQKRAFEAELSGLDASQKVFAGIFRKPDEIFLLNRGDPEQPKEEVAPAVLSTLGDVNLDKQTPEQNRRIALADWLSHPENPLTARVMVNRIWQGHFGAGIVQTPSDFGNNGMKPTHPELLDWLASEFIRGGWSMKHMHRLIVLSKTYRQSSASNDQGNEKDSDVRLLWRFPSRRLEAEAIRDSMLAISGQLNLQMYGRGYDLFDKRGGLSGFNPVEISTTENQRRMIYAHKVRRETEAVFGAFDCPDAGQSTAARRASTTPIQALNLFNSRFTLDQAEFFAARVKNASGDDATGQIRLAYQLTLNREPNAEELNETLPTVKKHGLAVLCRALFNSNEFLFQP
jgi:hypothetical protein